MIYLIFTSSILNKVGIINEEHRKNTYINSIKQTLSFLPENIKPIIVENNGFRETYLDDIIPVHYTDSNKINYFHKGINELDDIKSVINHYNINDEDTIIKITGRYHVLNDDFFKIVINNNTFDAFVKYYNVCTQKFMDDDCVLGLIAIKCKYLKKFEYTDFTKSPEVEFAMYCNTLNTYKINNLSLRCCFADNLRIRDY